MKVALYVHCFFPTHYHGTESYTLKLAKGLAALGHEPIVVTATPPNDPPQPDFIHRYEWEGIPVISIDKNEMTYTSTLDTYHQPAMAWVHERILEEIKPDVVHVCHILHHSTALLKVMEQMGLPTVATFTDFFSFCYTNILEAVDGGLCQGPSGSRANCMACHTKILATREPRLRLIAHPWVLPAASRAIALAGRVAGDEFKTPWLRPKDFVDRPGILLDAIRPLSAHFQGSAAGGQ